jgi:redox-regulated HSP33 family molecular chaperone
MKASTHKSLIIAVNTTNTTEVARVRHGLSRTTTKLIGNMMKKSRIIPIFLGKAFCGVAAISALMKGEERISLSWRGSGPLKVLNQFGN